MLKEDNWNSFTNLSDDELLLMLEGSPNDFQPSAWQAACEELQRRGGKDTLKKSIAENKQLNENADSVEESTSKKASSPLLCVLFVILGLFWFISAGLTIGGMLLTLFSFLLTVSAYKKEKKAPYYAIVSIIFSFWPIIGGNPFGFGVLLISVIILFIYYT